MKYNKSSRRMFLQGTGALLAIPFLESLAPLEARAQAAEPIRRYLNYTINYDLGHNRNWLPKLTTLANPLDIPGSPHKGSYESISSIMGGRSALSPILGSGFNSLFNKMMIYKGLDLPSHGVHCSNTHVLGSMFMIGYGSLDGNTPSLNPKTETINHFLARHSKFDSSKRSAISLGSGGMSWQRDSLGNIVPKGPVAGSAYEAYKIIFNNGTFPEGGSAPTAQNSRRDLLSRVMDDYSRTIAGRQIGASDKIVLTNALDSISDLQRGLAVQVANSCKHTDQDSRPETNKAALKLDDALSWPNYIKLITAIFQCDISRVITFFATPHNFEDWSPYPTQDYHGNITHKQMEIINGTPNWRRIGDLYGKHFQTFVAPLMQTLDNCIDPANGKSFLHNGLAQISAESVYPHRQANVPTVTLGSFNGALPTGYMVNYCDPGRPFSFAGGAINGDAWSDDPKDATDPMSDNHSYDYPGLPYQRFLVTLLQAAGLQRADYEDPNLNKHLLNRSDSLYGATNNGIADIGGYGITSFENITGLDAGGLYHHKGRMSRYNWHYYKFPIPLPPKV